MKPDFLSTIVILTFGMAIVQTFPNDLAASPIQNQFTGNAEFGSQTTTKKPTPDPYFDSQQSGSVSFAPGSTKKPSGYPLLGGSSGWDAPKTPTGKTTPLSVTDALKQAKSAGRSQPQSPQGSTEGHPLPHSAQNANNASTIIRELQPIQSNEPLAAPSNSFTVSPQTFKDTPNKVLQPVNDLGLDPDSSFTAIPTRQIIKPSKSQSTSQTAIQTSVANSTTTSAVAETKPVSPRVAGVTTISEVELKTFEPTRLLAKVGNEPIFVGDVLFEANKMIDQFMPTAPESLKNSERKKLIAKILPQFVDSKLLYVGAIAALPEGANVEQVLEQAGAEFDEKALPKMLESTGIKTPLEFDAQLRAQGYSLRKLRLSWSQDQLTKFLVGQQLEVDSEVTHQQMLDEYRKRYAEYAVPARARWEQVMVRLDRCDSRKDADEKLVEMGNQIVYGANMESIAKKNSHGFRASDGGQHDWTSKGSLVLKELDEAIFTLPVGQLSDKVETRDGFHIIRVLERTEATHKSFLEAQVDIKKEIQAEKRATAFKDFLGKLRDEITVEYYDIEQPSIVNR